MTDILRTRAHHITSRPMASCTSMYILVQSKLHEVRRQKSDTRRQTTSYFVIHPSPQQADTPQNGSWYSTQSHPRQMEHFGAAGLFKITSRTHCVARGPSLRCAVMHPRARPHIHTERHTHTHSSRVFSKSFFAASAQHFHERSKNAASLY